MSDELAQFCGVLRQARSEVRHFIAGPNVFICDECAQLCHRIVEGDGKPVGDKLVAFLARPPRRAVESWCIVNSSAINTVPMTPNLAGWSCRLTGKPTASPAMGSRRGKS